VHILITTEEVYLYDNDLTGSLDAICSITDIFLWQTPVGKMTRLTAHAAMFAVMLKLVYAMSSEQARDHFMLHFCIQTSKKHLGYKKHA
jgi:hypothetical protein